MYSVSLLRIMLLFEFLNMPPMMRVVAHAHAYKCVQFALQYFEAFVTIIVGKVDIDIKLFVQMRRFIEEQCFVGACSIGRMSALTHEHSSCVQIKNEDCSWMGL